MKKNYLIISVLVVVILLSGCVPYQLTKCMRFTSDVGKADCIEEVAEETENVDLCEYSSNKDNCYYIVISNLMFKNKIPKDITICDRAGSEKERCYGSVAVMTENINICETLLGFNKDSCFVRFALAHSDETACEKIENVKENTKEGCYSMIAVKKKDSSLCNKAGAKKEDCLLRVSIQ